MTTTSTRVEDAKLHDEMLAALKQAEAHINRASGGGETHIRAKLNAVISSAERPADDNWRPNPAELLANAVKAVTALDDYTNLNETEFTGWGDGEVPPAATWWRIKSGQALKALDELRALRSLSQGGSHEQ